MTPVTTDQLLYLKVTTDRPNRQIYAYSTSFYETYYEINEISKTFYVNFFIKIPGICQKSYILISSQIEATCLIDINKSNQGALWLKNCSSKFCSFPLDRIFRIRTIIWVIEITFKISVGVLTSFKRLTIIFTSCTFINVHAFASFIGFKN